MKTLWRVTLTAILTAAVLMAFVPQASAQTPPPGAPVLLGTTGACNNVNPGGPCTQTSTLVQIDPTNGALVRTIGPVGYTVNGLSWDVTSGKLYATTAVGDVSFHGLITIDPNTGQGTPVNASVVNYGLDITEGTLGSPVHSIAIDSNGNAVGWYDEFPPPVGVTDTFVTINTATGIAIEHNNTGINTGQNGVAFAKHDLLWNIDSPKVVNNVVTQTAYLLNPVDGTPLDARDVSPPTAAALGDFNPEGNQYYGLNFQVLTTNPTSLMVIDLKKGTVTNVGQTVNGLHVIAFIKHLP
ncbi:MAG: hypothetical protein LAO20_22715 [Acidobacteriia bacterium]|nr:hypothetical protein [Terriglobia bacterium]